MLLNNLVKRLLQLRTHNIYAKSFDENYSIFRIINIE